jgi:hypothetical protein
MGKEDDKRRVEPRRTGPFSSLLKKRPDEIAEKLSLYPNLVNEMVEVAKGIEGSGRELAEGGVPVDDWGRPNRVIFEGGVQKVESLTQKGKFWPLKKTDLTVMMARELAMEANARLLRPINTDDIPLDDDPTLK